MNFAAVIYAIGRLLQITGVAMVVPLAISLWDERNLHRQPLLERPETLAFLVAVLFAWLAGTVLAVIFRRGREAQGVREGFAIVTLGWVVLALIGAVPFLVWFLEQRQVAGPAGVGLAFTDAYFEIMSGFTNTGATILRDIESVPRGLLFWRSLTHWLGGMGIITLALAIFPAMGVGGYQMFRGEVPGPSVDRLRPRLTETAKILWGVYVLLSGAETGLLMLGGMSLFDALCHTFGTMGAGGFSTRNASIGAYGSAYIDWVVIVFMFLAGTNFLLHYRVLFKRDWLSVRTNREFHFYLGTVVLVTLLCTVLLRAGGLPAPEESARHYQFAPRSPEAHAAHVAAEADKVSGVAGALRQAAFQTVAIVTSTGFGTADFDVWPRACGIVLVVMMFWGGCAGSTSGGVKMIRILVVLKTGWRELKRMVRPRLISPLKVRRAPVDERMVASIGGFFILYVSLFVICSVLMSFFVPDLTTATSAVAATIGNIGPGLSGVGSTQTYAWISAPGKWVLVLCMLLGRLEIFTVLVVLRPSFWRR
ncbi:MAG: TrkH family potassium uptake protein [Candidatus Krumholzibacteriota bacterium]|nr:TrkH family potassium uptake protein [Candidatus Krumholzibacteriota bacterium]